MTPFLPHAVQAVAQALTHCQRRAMLLAYDTVGILAEQVESALQSQPLLDMLMPPLLLQWQGLPEKDRGLLGLMEAIKTLAAALGDRCLPAYVEVFFNRSAQIIWNTSGNIAVAKADPTGAAELEIAKVGYGPCND